VFLPDGTHVNHTLVKDGWCWWYRKYAPGNSELEKLEKDARDGKKGLWADPHPGPPWEWRKRKERCNTALGAGIHAVNAIVNDGLNRDRIEPPQPTVSTTSSSSFLLSLLSQAILSMFLSLFS
jgi:nuclease-like protein